MTCARLSRLLPVLALLLAALGPFAAAPAAAQTIWSATLTAQEFFSGAPDEGIGCSNSTAAINPAVGCNSSAVLTDDDITFGGVTYDVIDFLHVDEGNPGLVFSINKTIPDGHINSLVLVVGGRKFALADGVALSNDYTNDQVEWVGVSNPFTHGVGVRVSLEVRPLGTPWVEGGDGYLNVIFDPAPGPVTGYDVHYTASRTALPNAPTGANPAAGWVAVPATGGLSDTGFYVQPVHGLTNGRTYRVRARAKYGAIDTAWAFADGTAGVRPPAPPPLVFTPDENLLTGLTANDGVQNLPIEPNFAHATGFGGPGIYMVHVPPDVKSVTLTPKWTNTSITAVNASVRHITSGRPGSPVAWMGNASGEGRAIPLVQGNGSTLVTVSLTGVTAGSYRIMLTHHAGWRSANDRLQQLRIRAGNQ